MLHRGFGYSNCMRTSMKKIVKSPALKGLRDIQIRTRKKNKRSPQKKQVIPIGTFLIPEIITNNLQQQQHIKTSPS